jgi:hypothetical protein
MGGVGVQNPLNCMVGTDIGFDCIINRNLRMEIFFPPPPEISFHICHCVRHFFVHHVMNLLFELKIGLYITYFKR